MREIKFRAWDTQAKCMLGGGGMQLNATTGELNHLPPVIPMQYTGLKDKNSKEIYEGDILRCESNYVRLQTNEPTGEKSIKFYEVIWYETMWSTRDIAKNYTTKLATPPSLWAHYYEVIGNIYENPELLEVK